MTDPGPILGDTSSQDATVAALESFSIFDQPLLLFKVVTFQTGDLKLFAAKRLTFFLLRRRLTFIKILSSDIEHRI